MDNLFKTIGISLIVSVLVVLIGSTFGNVKQNLGTIGAGITNLSGVSITGTPGTFDVSNKATLNGSLMLTPTTGCIQEYATSTATSLKLTFIASTTAPTNGSGVIPVISYGTCP